MGRNIAIRKLRGNETAALTENYWQVKSVVFSHKSTIDDVYSCWKTTMCLLNEDEIVYLYYEVLYSQCKYNDELIDLVKILLKREYIDRFVYNNKENTADEGK